MLREEPSLPETIQRVQAEDCYSKTRTSPLIPDSNGKQKLFQFKLSLETLRTVETC